MQFDMGKNGAVCFYDGHFRGLCKPSYSSCDLCDDLICFYRFSSLRERVINCITIRHRQRQKHNGIFEERSIRESDR